MHNTCQFKCFEKQVTNWMNKSKHSYFQNAESKNMLKSQNSFNCLWSSPALFSSATQVILQSHLPQIKRSSPCSENSIFLILKLNRSLCVLYLNKCKRKSLYKKPMNLLNLFTQEKQKENVNMLLFIFVSYIKHLFSHWFVYDWEGNLFVGETEMLSIIDKVHFKDEKSCLLFFFLQLQV